MNDKEIKLRSNNRRSFLRKSGILILGSSLVSSSNIIAAQTIGESTLKVGLIGCGGRGAGAAVQALKADQNVVITAMGDIFEDRLLETYNVLSKAGGNKVKVHKDHMFVGFDSYLKVIESGVDVVLLTTPPAFRPDHLVAAVNAGLHIFCEKPVAVDAPGVRKVLIAAKMAKDKNLSLVSGFCYRYDYPNRATFSRILNGDLGEINTVSTFRNGGELWYKDKQRDWNQMTHQMRNWYYYNWLSGDFIVEQSVHSLDMMSWAMGDVLPISATGTGGRQARIDEKYGNIFDHFAVEFEYPNGAKGFHFTRQQASASNRNSVDVMGNLGIASINMGSKYEIHGKEDWKYTGKKNNMYQTQHDELFSGIRSGKPINDGKWMANSTMLAIWARMVSYTGKTISWDQALSSTQSLGPEIEDYNWDLKWEMPPIAVPGKTNFI